MVLYPGVSSLGVPGVPADQLTLPQSEGAHSPHPVLRAPPGFSDLATALKVNSVQEACAKYFEVHILKSFKSMKNMEKRNF